jgi:hypothetical protein
MCKKKCKSFRITLTFKECILFNKILHKKGCTNKHKQSMCKKKCKSFRRTNTFKECILFKKELDKKDAQININNQCVERNVSPLKEHLLLKDASS